MSIYSALFTGANSLKAFGDSVRVIGDNISNVSTLGFKSSNVRFGDMVGEVISITEGSIPNQVGNGAKIAAVEQNNTKGSMENSTLSTHMAINGSGLFVLKDPVNGGTYYSRVGAFDLDKNFNLVGNHGKQAMGWLLDGAGNPVGSTKGISVKDVTSTAQATNKIDVGVNLNSTSSIIDPAITPFDPNTASTYSYKSDVQVYDTLGLLHTVGVYFSKIGSDASGNTVWDWHVAADGADVGGVPGVLQEVGAPTTSTVGPPAVQGTQSLTFSPASGALVNEAAPAISFPWTGASASSINLNFGSATTVDQTGVTGSGNDGVLQLATAFTTRFMDRNGYPAGSLDRIEVNKSGKMFGVFSNGQTRPLYQLAIASFPNESALMKAGNTLLTETVASGPPVIDKAGSNSNGTISSYVLEQSNVDIASEFVKMIIVQRGYEANSKVVLTSDQMLTTLMALKR